MMNEQVESKTVEAGGLMVGISKGASRKARKREPLPIVPRLLTIEQTACYLGISARTLYNRTGPKSKNPFPIRPKRTLGKPLFDRVELDRWIDTLDATSNEAGKSL